RRGWRIALPEGDTILANHAVSTSGDTEQFVIIGGVRYSHVIDPRTGMGLTSRREASVVAPDGVMADGLATALTLLDDARGARLLQSFRRRGRGCGVTACRSPSRARTPARGPCGGRRSCR